ncbi:iron dicitrate transporter FecR [Chitinophaga terrae (ex Kim and Jung 2007)]|nr:iron dicitrate transporter FecR [Chitinophaga terrae (ex Kim and Jung 2007)]
MQAKPALSEQYMPNEQDMTSTDEQDFRDMEQIADLLLRRLQETLSAEEEAFLDKWLSEQSPASREFYTQATTWPVIEQELQRFNAIDDATAGIMMQEWLKVKQPARRVLWPYWAAAAAVILFIGAGIWYMNRPAGDQPPAMPMAERYRNEILPGGDKALLQLADGSTIVLDSTKSGSLALQGNTRILKNDQGEIVYKAGRDVQPVYNKISTPRGGQYTITLPDGTRVWLNASTTLRYPTAFTGNERIVELSGEAYFEVAQDANRHFRVQTNTSGHQPLNITVLGTSFNVQAYTDEPAQTTTLLTGKVSVGAGSQAVVLQPGRKAVLDKTAAGFNVQAADTAAALAWKEGFIYMQDADLAEIMRQISRWYDVDIVFEGNVTKQFDGKIPRDTKLTTVLKALESTGWVQFKVVGKTVTVYPTDQTTN